MLRPIFFGGRGGWSLLMIIWVEFWLNPSKESNFYLKGQFYRGTFHFFFFFNFVRAVETIGTISWIFTYYGVNSIIPLGLFSPNSNDTISLYSSFDAKSEKNETRTYETSNFVENGISCGFLDDNDNLKETEQSKELLITDMILTAIETLKIRKQRGFS